MRLAMEPPAEVQLPPAIRLPLYTANAYTSELIPLPSACQLVPFQPATFDAKTSPATVNLPPTTSRGDKGPGPSGSQVVTALTSPFTPGTPWPGFQANGQWAPAAGGRMTK